MNVFLHPRRKKTSLSFVKIFTKRFSINEGLQTKNKLLMILIQPLCLLLDEFMFSSTYTPGPRLEKP
jgi:hypothetical protein